MDNFDRSVEFVLKHEGGYINHPEDPGGETKFGISRRAYPHLNIKELTLERAREIYKQDYWDKTGCSDLKWPMCLVVFDTATNCGVARALEFKGRTTDSRDYLFYRTEYYNSLHKSVFLEGWINRVLDLWRKIRADEHPVSENYV